MFFQLDRGWKNQCRQNRTGDLRRQFLSTSFLLWVCLFAWNASHNYRTGMGSLRRRDWMRPPRPFPLALEPLQPLPISTNYTHNWLCIALYLSIFARLECPWTLIMLLNAWRMKRFAWVDQYLVLHQLLLLPPPSYCHVALGRFPTMFSTPYYRRDPLKFSKRTESLSKPHKPKTVSCCLLRTQLRTPHNKLLAPVAEKSWAIIEARIEQA